MIAWLISLDGELAGKRFSLDSICLVGRGQYNHIVLDDTRISRQHAKIAPEGGQYVLQDLNSANGSYVNETPVSRQHLAADDVVRFGPFRFKVEMQAQPVEPRTPQPQAQPFREARTIVGMDAVNYLREESDSGNHPRVRRTGLLHLEDADRKLRTLYAFLQSIATTIDEDELVDRVLRNLLDVYFEADCVALHRYDSQARRLLPRMVLRRDGTVPPAFGLPPQVADVVLKDGRPLLLPTGRRVGRSMHVPLLVDGKVQGTLDVRAADSAEPPFGLADLELLSGLAGQATMALDNVRMHQAALRQQRLQLDLKLAEQIQKSFLPRHLPSVPGLEFATKYKPAFLVGGDFYDVFWLNYDKIGVLIGDVAGKGVSAALLMARITSDLRLAAMMVPEPAQVMGHVNRIVYERGQPDVFVTAIYMTMDVRKHRVHLANAGHIPPLLRRRVGARLERIDGGASTAIGIFDEAEFDQVEFDLQPGDTLLLTTDGVVEATNSQGLQFGFAHLERAVASTFSTRPSEVVSRIEQDLHVHMAGAAQNDDLTVIACGIAAPIAARVKRNDEPTQPTIKATYERG